MAATVMGERLSGHSTFFNISWHTKQWIPKPFNAHFRTINGRSLGIFWTYRFISGSE